MLQINALSLSFLRYQRFFTQEKIRRLTDINLHIGAGEICAVIGHSGAGKTLLAHAILGLLPKNIDLSGEMLWDNTKLTPQKRAALRGKEIAFLPQQISYLDPTATIGSQLLWSAHRAGVTIHLHEQLRAVELAPMVAKLYPHQLSGGMARRVLMAQATLTQRQLIIADEPTAGLDPHNRRIILQHLRAQADKGCAILLITHDLIPLLDYADKITILHEGKIVTTARPEEFHGSGSALTSPYAQALWRALPENGFS